MSDPPEAIAQWTRGLFSESAERLFQLGTLIASWLVLGNAGALVVAFNAMASGRICDYSAFTPITWSFVYGLGAAFVGVVLTYFIGMYGVRILGSMSSAASTVSVNEFYIAKLESQGIEVGDESPLEKGKEEAIAVFQREKSRLWRMALGTVLSILFFAVSVFYFARGVVLPLDSQMAAMCAADVRTG